MAEIDRLDGTIVAAEIEGRRVSFFVNDKSDYIQGYHNLGVFYETEEISIIRRHFQPGGTFVDVGANIGNHTLYAALYMNPRVVIPFEVNPPALKVLRTNLLLNPTASVDARYLGVGLGAADTRLSLVASPPGNLGGTRFAATADGPLIAIAGDGVLMGTPVSFIKIDIEGMELEALRGLAGTIRRWRPSLFVEVTDPNLQAVLEFTRAHDLKLVAQWQRYQGMSNYMFIP